MAVREVNAQYNISAAGSLSQRTAAQARARMFEMFMEDVRPQQAETVVDVGVTSDQTYDASNYFEFFYPWKEQVTAAGIDDARFLEVRYPGMRFVEANILDLPFGDGSFDILHSAAVWEHVGSRTNQARMLAECLRVAKRAVFLTTPNRWFPIEVHTQVPLLHWLPPGLHRPMFRTLGLEFFAAEENLNLLSIADIRRLTEAHPDWKFRFRTYKLFGWPSNILMIAERR